jgi:hypothetical protein
MTVPAKDSKGMTENPYGCMFPADIWQEGYQAGIKKALEEVEKLHLFTGEVPVEGKDCQFVGCYILRWGKDKEPTMMFSKLGDTDELESLKSKLLGVV